MVVEGRHLFNCPVLMFKQTSVAVWTETFAMELFAALGLVLFVVRKLLREFLLAMRKLALIVIGTVACLNPILAHLSLVLRLVCFLQFGNLRLLRSLLDNIGVSIFKIRLLIWRQEGFRAFLLVPAFVEKFLRSLDGLSLAFGLLPINLSWRSML